MEYNFNVVNFVRKTNEGEAESIALLIFVLWCCFSRRWVRSSGVGIIIQYQLKSPLFQAGVLSEVISMTHSNILYRLGISTFYFCEPLQLQIFVPWKCIKTSAFPCLLQHLLSAATQITTFINIFVSNIIYRMKSFFFIKICVKRQLVGFEWLI